MDRYLFIAFLEEIEVTENLIKSMCLDIPLELNNVVNEICSKLIPLYLGGSCCKIVKHSDISYTLYTDVDNIYSDYRFNEKILNEREEKIKKIFSEIFQEILLVNDLKCQVKFNIDSNKYNLDINIL